MTNSWDFPSYLLLTMAILGLGCCLWRNHLRVRIALWVALGLSVSLFSIVSFLPFHQYYEAFNAGLEASKWQTPVGRYLWIHGLFLFVVVTFLGVHLRQAVAINAGAARFRGLSLLGAFRVLETPGTGLAWPRVVLLLGLVLGAFLAAAGYWTAALLTALLAATGAVGVRLAASEDHRNPYVLMPLMLLGMALAISIGVDIVRIEGDIGRMNTLFKYYLEVWILLSLASAYMLWYLVDQGNFRVRPAWLKVVWLGVLLALIGCSLIYTVLGTRARLAYRFDTSTPVTLDGTAYMQKAVYTGRRGLGVEVGLGGGPVAPRQRNRLSGGLGSPLSAIRLEWTHSLLHRLADYPGLAVAPNPAALGEVPTHHRGAGGPMFAESTKLSTHLNFKPCYGGTMWSTSSLERWSACITGTRE